jgi:selenoprotein W-related protein
VLGIEPKLIKGSNGIFDVALDGELIFSKYQSGGFPDEEEIIKIIKP